MVMLPWDQRRVEDTARRADAAAVGRAATPYRRAGTRLLGDLTGRMVAANPTRGAAGSRSAALVAAPEMARLATAGADATNAARATAAANMAARERAYAENNAQLFGLGLNAGGAVLGTLTSGLGGMGGGTPGAGGGSPGGLGGLLGAAAPIAGTAMAGPAGGAAGAALGSVLGGASTPTPLGGAVPGSRVDLPLGGYRPSTPGMYDSGPADPMAAMTGDPAMTPDGVDRIPIAPRGGFATPLATPPAAPAGPAGPALGPLVGLPGTGEMTEEEMRRAGLLSGRF